MFHFKQHKKVPKEGKHSDNLTVPKQPGNARQKYEIMRLLRRYEVLRRDDLLKHMQEDVRYCGGTVFWLLRILLVCIA